VASGRRAAPAFDDSKRALSKRTVPLPPSPLARGEFWECANALAAAGVIVLVTTHFMDEANYCDRPVIMADGEA